MEFCPSYCKNITTVSVCRVCRVYVCDVGAVTFTEDDTYEVSSTRCRLSLTVVELRKRVADRLNMPCSAVRILQHGNHTPPPSVCRSVRLSNSASFLSPLTDRI